MILFNVYLIFNNNYIYKKFTGVALGFCLEVDPNKAEDEIATDEKLPCYNEDIKLIFKNKKQKILNSICTLNCNLLIQNSNK